MPTIVKSIILLVFFVYFANQVTKDVRPVKPLPPLDTTTNVTMPDVDPATPPYDPCQHDPTPIECVLRHIDP